MDETTTKQQALQVRSFVEELRALAYLAHEELAHIIDKYEAFLKKTYGDNCHQIRFLRRITFKPSTDNNKERVIMTIWYGGLNEVIVLSNTLLEEYGEEASEEPITYELPEELEEEEDEDDEAFFPSKEAAAIAQKIKEIEAEEELQQKKGGIKEKEDIKETPPELKELEKRVDVIADVLTFIFNGGVWFIKGTWKVLSGLIIRPEKLFKDWKEKVSASMEYKPMEETEQRDSGDVA